MSALTPQSYQRAVAGALLGLGAQLAAAAGLAAIAFAGDPIVFLPAAWYAAGGIPVWLCLLLLYHQHRLERMEALEAERLASAGPDTQLFGETAAELNVAQRRLEQLRRIGLPLTGLCTGIFLLAGAIWRIGAAETWLSAHAESAHGLTRPLLPMAFALGIAFATFLIGRYVAGMTRQAEWILLRGGAGFLMGTALVSAAVTLALAFVHFESYALLHYLPFVLCVLEGLLGAEMLAGLVLNLYRPRKPGETPRPAFDSRLLGLLTSPGSLASALQEAVNYQFGFEVTRSWFWKLLSRWLAPLAGVGVAALLLLSCLVKVEPQQQALVLRFGELSRSEPLEPGLHLKWPWPVERAELYDVTRIRQIVVGSHAHLKDDQAPILWNNQHAEAEELLLVAPPRALIQMPQGNGETGGGKAPSVSLLAAEVFLNFRIKDLVAYSRHQKDPEAALVALAERETARVLLAGDEDTWLGPERAALGPKLRELLQAEADRERLGLDVVFVGMAGIHPPQEVAEAFHRVVQAHQEREARIEVALREAIGKLAAAAGTPELARSIGTEIERLETLRQSQGDAAALAAQETKIEALLQAAGGEASKRIAEARAYRHERENAERAKAERFERELLAYARAPRLYRMRRYLEVLADGLAERRKYLLLADRRNLTVRFDLKDQGAELAPVNMQSKE